MPNDQKNIPPEVQNDSDTNNEAPRLTNVTNEVVTISEATKELSILSDPHTSNCERNAVNFSMPSTSSFTRITQFTSGNIITVSFGRLANGFHNPKMNETPRSAQTLGNISNVSTRVEKRSNVSADIIESKVASLVKLMLLKYQMKEPITKEEMIQTVIKNYEQHFNEIFFKAHKRMEMIFGLDVKEINETNHCYVFIISLGLTFDGMGCGKEGVPKTGILILILGIIFMKDNSATEEDIWDILNQIGIYENEHHFVFGDTKDLITNHFVRENYLVYRRRANESSCFEFLWGKRAHAETSKMKVLEFMAMVNETVPSDFGYKYEEALEDEINRGLAKDGFWA